MLRHEELKQREEILLGDIKEDLKEKRYYSASKKISELQEISVEIDDINWGDE